MKTSVLPSVSSARWLELEMEGGLFILDHVLKCGPFKLEFLATGRGKNKFIGGAGSAVVLEGEVVHVSEDARALATVLPWQSAKITRRETLRVGEQSFLIKVSQLDPAPVASPWVSDFKGPWLNLPITKTAFWLRWVEFSSVPNLYRTQPDVVVGDWHIKLWRALPNMNCGVHRHSQESWLRETHFLLAGSGDMVVYETENPASEVRRVPVAFGQTHELFFRVKFKNRT